MPIFKPKRIYEEVAEEIRDWILKGQLKPGEKLPSEEELLRIFGVSRASLREAFRLLESMGLVETILGRGRFVRPLPEIDVGSPKVFYEALMARELLEPTITRYAAKCASLEDIERIKRVVEDMDRKEVSIDELLRYDQEFHLEVAKATHNFLLINITMDYLNIIRSLGENTLRVPGRKEKSVREHKKIFEAIVSKNEEMAFKADLEHVRNVREMIERLYGKGE
ncbi:MAG: FadR family transcriptional regulator [Synergistetes bacterium]|nr:MAG: GntR domain protein [bacterium 42_11]MBC7331945.1 FadR family transcriptional regulator [Synergistota bacterium]MDK2871105.1 GntR family transcriptional regulator, transcriptional repressor for pyruvate dehydrogenase complex [bacterium]